MIEKIQPFTTIQFRTSSGENCTAQKDNGVVTIQGDKYGVRKMPVNDFMNAFVKDQTNKLERTPDKDVVSFSGKKGSYGQDIDNPHDDLNKMDPRSHHFDPNGFESMSEEDYQTHIEMLHKTRKQPLHKGSYGQDIFDQYDDLNKMDPRSHHYSPNGFESMSEEDYHIHTDLKNKAAMRKGSYGQHIDNPHDDLNKIDPRSPHFDPNGFESMSEEDYHIHTGAGNRDAVIRGSFGQDLNDPDNDLNKIDLLSPYYEGQGLLEDLDEDALYVLSLKDRGILADHIEEAREACDRYYRNSGVFHN